jgi:predicted anti-sigma-YlaC factor YlaD
MKSTAVSGSSRPPGRGSPEATSTEVSTPALAPIELEIGLEDARYRHLGWAVFGSALGALMIWKLGTVAQWAGGVLVGFGAWATFNFVRTLIWQPGAIAIDATRVQLPRGPSRGKAVEVPRADIAHAYLLRRAVPWTKAAPVLIIETGSRAFAFPRDWFASEADQRRVIHALAPVGVAPEVGPYRTP